MLLARSRLIVTALAGSLFTVAANAVPIDFRISDPGASWSTSGINAGLTLSIAEDDDLAGRTFSLDEGEHSGYFDFLRISATGYAGVVAGTITASLNFVEPVSASAQGVLGGFGIIFGSSGFGGISVISNPSPVNFGGDGWFEVSFRGFEDWWCEPVQTVQTFGSYSYKKDYSKSACTLSGVVQAKVKLKKAPTNVPEPGTLGLLGASLFAIGAVRRIRRRR